MKTLQCKPRRDFIQKKIKLLFYEYFDSFDFCFVLLLYLYFVRFLLFLLYYSTVKI